MKKNNFKLKWERMKRWKLDKNTLVQNLKRHWINVRMDNFHWASPRFFIHRHRARSKKLLSIVTTYRSQSAQSLSWKTSCQLSCIATLSLILCSSTAACLALGSAISKNKTAVILEDSFSLWLERAWTASNLNNLTNQWPQSFQSNSYFLEQTQAPLR